MNPVDFSGPSPCFFMKVATANRCLPRVIVAAVALYSCTFASDAQDAQTDAVARAIEKVKPALVRINVVMTTPNQGREIKNEGAGSGTIISPDGFVITNHHVAGHVARVTCTLSTNEEIPATLAGTDAATDISVLKLQGGESRRYPFCEFGDSDKLKMGDIVVAMGSPMAISQSVTLGIVSNSKMVIPDLLKKGGVSLKMDGEEVGELVRWVAHDAAIYPGNSGGPLLDSDGRIVGVNEISLGLGGAIPGNLARDVSQQIIHYGRARRSWIGVEPQPLLKGTTPSRGVLVAGVIPNSPAEKADIQPGDIIENVDEKDVDVRYAEELPLFNQTIASLPIEQPVSVRLRRGGDTIEKKVNTIEQEAARPKVEELQVWGITARSIGLVEAFDLKLKSRDGVLVTTLRPGGPCGEAKPSLQERDIIHEVGGQPVKALPELVALTASLTKDKTDPVPVTVRFHREGEQYLTVVKLGGSPRKADLGAEARSAWLPVAVQAITRELAEQFGDAQLAGVRVTQVFPKSSAEKAGLKEGDLVLKLDGEKIAVSSAKDEERFFDAIRERRVGAKVELTVLRAGQTLALTAELEREPVPESELPKFEDAKFEFTARDLGYRDKVDEAEPEKLTGVLVTEVKIGGWAGLAGLKNADIIQTIDGAPIGDVAALEAALKRVAAARPKYVALRVRRESHTRFVQFEPTWQNP
jgi:serine protease Do